MRVIWMVLDSGRSVFAGCGAATRAAVESALTRNGTITIASDETVERIPTTAVRDFVVFETRGRFLDRSAICPSLLL